MLTKEWKYLAVVEEMMDKGISNINQYTAIEYLHDELEKARKIDQDSKDIELLLSLYRKSMSQATTLINRIVEENKQLKQKLKYKHELNSCLMYVIELGGVKADE